MRYIVLAIVSIAIGVMGALYCTRIPNGKLLVSQTFLDSLAEVANRPPKVTIKVDTFKMPYPVYVNVPVPVPTPVGDANYYQDTLKNNHLMVVVRDTVRNNCISYRDFEYRLFVPLTIEKTITINYPVPIPYKVVERVTYKWHAGIGYAAIGAYIRGGMQHQRIGIGALVAKNNIGVDLTYYF